MKMKVAAILFDRYRNVWELWYKSRPVVESAYRERVEEYAAQHGYDVVT